MAKREINKERAARERDRGITLKVARNTANLIKQSRKNEAALATEPMKESPAEYLKAMGYQEDSKLWRIHAYIGAAFCGSHESIPKFMRLVADILEGKEPHSPGNDWYDKAIMAAYNEALSRHPPYVPPRVRDIKNIERYIFWWPSFAQFRAVFDEQNPASKLARPPSDRSLRRSLKRLGCLVLPVKRGRPRQK